MIMKSAVIISSLINISIVAADYVWHLGGKCDHTPPLDINWISHEGPQCVVLPFSLEDPFPGVGGTYLTGCCAYKYSTDPKEEISGTCVYNTRTTGQIHNFNECTDGIGMGTCATVTFGPVPNVVAPPDPRIVQC